MKNKKSPNIFIELFFVVIIGIILLLVIGCVENSKVTIVGFWGHYFPAPDAVHGFVFLNTNQFFYNTFLTSDYTTGYSGCSGIWKVEHGFLYIKQQYEFVWQKPWVNDPDYGWDAGDDNELLCKKIDMEWMKISDLSTYQKTKDKNKPDTMIFTIPNKPDKTNMFWLYTKEPYKKRTPAKIIEVYSGLIQKCEKP